MSRPNVLFILSDDPDPRIPEVEAVTYAHQPWYAEGWY